MKRIMQFIFLFFIISSKAFSLNTTLTIRNYDKIFQKIDKSRVGPSDRELDRIPSPFIGRERYIFLSKNITFFKPVRLKLYGIFNNRAKINNRWYKIGSKLFGYRLIKIKNNSVVLNNNKKVLELFLRKKDEKIQIKF